MKFLRAIALLVALVAVPLGAPADTVGSVRGYIRCIDCSGLPPIKGVTVTVSGRNGVWKSATDAHGFYVIFGIAPGRYKIAVHDRSMRYLPQTL